MTREEIDTYFRSLPVGQQIVLLAGLAHEITIIGRASYSNGPNGQVASSGTMIDINELQHHVSGQIRHLAKGDEKRYPDDVLLNILFERAEHGHFQEEFIRGFECVISTEKH